MADNEDDAPDGQLLDRAALRLDGLEIYSMIGALQAGTSVAIMQELGTLDEADHAAAVASAVSGQAAAATVPAAVTWMATDLIRFAFLVCGTAASLGGIYSTIMFALCSLYGKTALGLGRDRMYEHFMKVTGPQRFRAFNSFTTSLMLFCIQVVMLFALKSPSQFRIPATIAASVVIYVGRRDCNGLMAAATPIFTNKLPPSDETKIEEAEEDEEKNTTTKGANTNMEEEKKKKKKKKKT